MTWPSDPNYSTLVKTDMDAGGDSPANARAQLEALLDRVNSVQALLEEIIENGRPLTLAGAETLTARFTLFDDATAPLHPVSKRQLDKKSTLILSADRGPSGNQLSGANIVWPNVVVDTESGYNASTGVYTFQSAGTFLVSINFEFRAVGAAGLTLYHWIGDTGNSYPRSQDTATMVNGSQLWFSRSFVITAAANEIVKTQMGGSWTNLVADGGSGGLPIVYNAIRIVRL